jgi:hypothetical protein
MATSFGEEIGPATTVIPAMGDQVGPFTTRMRKVAPEPVTEELELVLVVVELCVVLLVDGFCIATTAIADVAMTTIKMNTAIVVPIALRERPRSVRVLSEFIVGNAPIANIKTMDERSEFSLCFSPTDFTLER